ncbi:HPr kinase/phosphatase C-terminal domain-containing protein [Brevundimonas sp.]|uniref:HPr kinase/phosphorylase n=1 Tax=Brevundimonas sp. TaxID=1871086 RepID=UPI002D6CD541|nr:HPr kinase/phosphatase C-terminal domain-containing protein [Brevundimonas sp.]HYC75072.1 HPr kinase/phosphatase C-terminal domain-containing protein [Brevundimonas sp.]
MSGRQPLHGTVAARWRPGVGWRAVLITGPAGAGKSDLTLRLIGRGWRLVADDYAHVIASGGVLYAVAPETIAGRMEARGVGVVPACARGLTRLSLTVDLTGDPVERLPETETRVFEGVALPLLRLNGFEASAVEKVATALARL